VVQVSVFNNKGKEAGAVELPGDVFGVRINTAVLHQAVVMYHTSQRQGTVAVKDRRDVSGGGKKPFRQKGTGRARAGSSRSPLWHGGGIVFGPQPRDFANTLPLKIRKAALRESLNAKYQDGDIICIDDLTTAMSKTKEFVSFLKALNIQGHTLALLNGCDATIERVSRNVPLFELMRAEDVNAYDILRHKKIMVTRSALQKLLERIQQ
jgi:large subunit ribosomal protein L4